MKTTYKWTAATSNGNSVTGIAETAAQAATAAMEHPVNDGGWLETIIISNHQDIIVKALSRTAPDAMWKDDPGLPE